MVTFELVEFVKEQLERGISKEEISSVLSDKGGWQAEHIEHAIFLAEYGHHVGDEGLMTE